MKDNPGVFWFGLSVNNLGGTLSRAFLYVLGAVVITGALVDGYAVGQRRAADKEFERQALLGQTEGERIRAQVTLLTKKPLVVGQNFAGALENFGLSAEQATQVTAAAQRAFNLRQLRAGNPITIGRSVVGNLKEIDYKIDADRILHIVPQAPGFAAEVRNIPSSLEVSTVSGILEDSLFNAVEQAGESPELAMRLAQIFGYDLDFYTDPRRGDTFHIVLEKRKYANNEEAGYGRILAAEYDNGGKKYQALLFHDPQGHPAYYAADGKSLQKAFLRSPLKFGAPVTSHFSKARYHPILKLVRPHLGTDYGAPVGTPVQTIGSGRVEFAASKDADGNMVKIAHAQGYVTMYLHLSRVFVHVGEHVDIGKTIGLVGATGLATGPHLDFRISRNGQFLNFERLGLPPSDPVSKQDWPEFAVIREKWLPLLGTSQPLQASYGQAAASGH